MYLAVTEQPIKKGSLLKVPSRSSSQTKQDPSSTSGLTGATAADDGASLGQESKRSILGRKRDGSKSSSHKSARPEKDAESTRAPGPAIPQSDGPAARTTKKKSSSFLAFLNCCGGPDSNSSIDLDDPTEPAKKTTKLQPVRARQPESSEKTETRDPEEKDAQAINSFNEKDGVVMNSGQGTLVAEEQKMDDTSPPLARKISSYDKVTPMSIPVPGDESVNFPSNPHDQPLPSLPPEAIQIAPHEPPKTDLAPKPDVNVQAATPIEPESHAQNQDWPSSGSMGDSDIDMSDAPAEVPTEEKELPAEPPQAEPQAAKIDLPPPPPLVKRDSQIAHKEAPVLPASAAEEQAWLLPPVQPHLKGRKCLVLDLDETLVHSSFKILNQADFTIPVEIEGQYHNVYVIKRPGVDAFMKRVGEIYEVVVFTASVSKYGDPLLDQLDIHHVVHHRLFRESCYNHQGNYVKVSLRLVLYIRFLTDCVGPFPSRS